MVPALNDAFVGHPHRVEPSDQPPIYDTFVDYVERTLPEARDLVAEVAGDVLRHGEGDENPRDPYMVTTEVIVERLLFPALDRGDQAAAARYLAVAEVMLASPDGRLRDLASIRFAECLSTSGQAARYGPLAEPLLGPRLRDKVHSLRWPRGAVIDKPCEHLGVGLIEDTPADGPDALYQWARPHTPSLAKAWDELAAEWQPAPPTDTDVILFVLAPGLVEAVHAGDLGAANEVATMVEAMATHDQFMWNHVAVTAAPAIAEKVSPEDLDRLLSVLGPQTRNLVEGLLGSVEH